MTAVRTETAKLIKYAGHDETQPDRWHLFDHQSPAGESRDVAAEHPEVVERLRKRLGEFAAAQEPPGLPQAAVLQDQRFFDYLASSNAVAPAAILETGERSTASGKKRQQSK